MTIRFCRFYIELDDPEITKQMNLFHWGVANWLEQKIKTIKERLKGPEVKGVNIVNIHFWESSQNNLQRNEWIRVINTFEYRVIYDFGTFNSSRPIENIQKLMLNASEFMLKAPWPQVRAIGELLSSPLSTVDLEAIQLCLDKHEKRYK